MKNASTRILAILLAVLMLFGMAACSKSGSKESPGAPGGSTQPEQVPGQTSGESENAETDGSMESDMLAEDQTLGYYVGNDPGTIDPWVNNSGSAAPSLPLLMSRCSATPTTSKAMSRAL